MIIELLAVIAILAILVVIAVPNIMKVYSASKKKLFVTDIQTVLKSTESYIITEQLKSTSQNITVDLSNDNSCGATELDKFDVTLNYYIEVNGGHVTAANFSNKEFSLTLSGSDIKIEDAKVNSVVKLETGFSICP